MSLVARLVARDAVALAGVAPGDIHAAFAWQEWRLVTSTFVLHGRRGAFSTGLGLVARMVAVSRPINLRFARHAWQAWHLHQGWVWWRGICVAGVALGVRFAWQAWRFQYWTFSYTTFSNTTPSHTSFTQLFSHTSLTYTTLSQLSHTTLSHSYKNSFTTFTTFSHTTLSHTTLSHTIFLTKLCHTQLFHIHSHTN